MNYYVVKMANFEPHEKSSASVSPQKDIPIYQAHLHLEDTFYEIKKGMKNCVVPMK